MVVPQSAWSMSRAGFLASAHTPLVWLVGLGLTGGRLYGERTCVGVAFGTMMSVMHAVPRRQPCVDG